MYYRANVMVMKAYDSMAKYSDTVPSLLIHVRNLAVDRYDLEDYLA